MRVHTTVRGLYSMYLLVLPTCKFTTRVAPFRLGGLYPFLIAGSVHAKRKSVFASIAFAIAPRCASSGKPT
ncbi:MAG: hypothetical protein CMN89_12010 [Sutterellaceae bacterium]|uniref:hypothetical protein n=1 Tax=Limnobacter sp. UBA6514 TaxID=1946761 RepID=UPI000C531F01|nr:hypothetical protein [Limnobacter sp. UBA6514]MAG79911.1 hypothetical protein [Sutterellaceae bacterium]MBT85179.1 hypothetical protein [Sutterellaceae bacterium]